MECFHLARLMPPLMALFNQGLGIAELLTNYLGADKLASIARLSACPRSPHFLPPLPPAYFPFSFFFRPGPSIISTASCVFLFYFLPHRLLFSFQREHCLSIPFSAHCLLVLFSSQFVPLPFSFYCVQCLHQFRVGLGS